MANGRHEARVILAVSLMLAWLTVERSARSEEVLTLTEALAIGKERAPTLVAARAHASSAEANVDAQRAAYFPTLTASLTGSGSGTRDTQQIPPPGDGLFAFVTYSGAASGAASVRWTPYDFGRTSGVVASARGGRASALANVATTKLRVMSDVASAYVTLYYKEELHDVARATLGQRERLVDLAKGLIHAGLQPPLEEIRASARAEVARVQLAAAEADVYDAQAALASLLALDPSLPVRVAPPRLPRFDVDASDAVRAADRLPSIAGAQADFESKRALVDAASARYLPSIALAIDGSYRFTRVDTNSVFVNTRAASGALTVTVPLFDASIGPNLDGARADAATAASLADQARLGARNEAARTAFAVRTSAVALEHAKSAADGAATVLTIVQARYAQGLSSPLDLIEAEGADSDARIARAQAELAHALAVVRAFAAIGRDIVEAGRGL